MNRPHKHREKACHVLNKNTVHSAIVFPLYTGTSESRKTPAACYHRKIGLQAGGGGEQTTS